jgi:hypothetical protein
LAEPAAGSANIAVAMAAAASLFRCGRPDIPAIIFFLSAYLSTPTGVDHVLFVRRIYPKKRD